MRVVKTTLIRNLEVGQYFYLATDGIQYKKVNAVQITEGKNCFGIDKEENILCINEWSEVFTVQYDLTGWKMLFPSQWKLVGDWKVDYLKVFVDSDGDRGWFISINGYGSVYMSDKGEVDYLITELKKMQGE